MPTIQPLLPCVILMSVLAHTVVVPQSVTNCHSDSQGVDIKVCERALLNKGAAADRDPPQIDMQA